jgi:hypothetical protein
MSFLKSLLTVAATVSTVGSIVGQTAGLIDPHTGQIILGGAAIAGIAGHSITDVIAAWRGATSQPQSPAPPVAGASQK